MKFKKTILATCSLLLLSTSLLGCDASSLAKFTLESPVIKVKDLTVSWEEIESADNYKIYNADTDVVLDETKETTYTFRNIENIMSVYVRACYEENSFMFHNSKKSNVERVKPPVLRPPFVTSSENYVVWSAVYCADYYKVYNNSDDSLIGETEELSYQFVNNSRTDLDVYVRAFYRSVQLIDKASIRSNVTRINPDLVAIDVGESELSDTNYLIGKYVQTITFKGTATSSWNLVVEDRTTPLEITFDNLVIQNETGAVLTANNPNYDINLHIIGDCTLTSKDANGIKANKMKIDGSTNAKLLATGGRGADGADGREGFVGAEDGGRGENGAPGEDGHDGYSGIDLESLTISNIALTANGGDGGNGGNGGNGGIGGEGKTYVNILYGKKDEMKNYGGNGGNGGRGGNGGAPADGINKTCIINNIDSSSTIVVTTGIYGNGGNGGNGGKGGKGGNYYNEWGSVHRCSGGSGGNGGNGGDGLIPGSGGQGGSVGDRGTGHAVSGIGVGIVGGTFDVDENNPTAGSNGADGNAIGQSQ